MLILSAIVLYPGWQFAYNKIEKAIAAMGERGTKILRQVEGNEEIKKKA
jgi:hypothetical protein